MPRKKPEAEADVEIAHLKQRIAELEKDHKQRVHEMMERIRLKRQAGIKRLNLLKHCRRNNYDRADMRWVIAELPLERVSAKHRFASEEKAKLRRPRNKQNNTAILYLKFAVVIDKAMRSKMLTPQQVADNVKVHVSS